MTEVVDETVQAVAVSGGLSRLLDRVVRFRTPRSTWARVLLAGVGIASFAVLVTIAVINLPNNLGGIRWWLVGLAAVVGVPLSLAVNSLEYHQQARLAGVPIDHRTALHVSAAGSAANLLPVPGSVLVRAAHLRRSDAAYKDIGLATSAVAATYVSIALLIGGLAVLSTSPFGGTVALVMGVVGLVAGVGFVRACRPKSVTKSALRIVALEIASMASGAVRMGLLLAALGHASFGGAVSLVVADVIAGAVGFLPAGLGLRELLAALLGPVGDVPASVAVVATAFDRLITIVVVGGTAAVVSYLRRHR